MKLLPGLTILALLGIYEIPWYFLTPDQVSLQKYHTESFVNMKRWGERLGKILRPGETFFQWGGASSLYFYSHRDPPDGFINTGYLYMGPHLEAYREKALRDLTLAKPEIFILSRPLSWQDIRIWEASPLKPWVDQNYVFLPIAGNRQSLLLFMRRGGRLDLETTPQQRLLFP
jgi:hypothetical protein